MTRRSVLATTNRRFGAISLALAGALVCALAPAASALPARADTEYPTLGISPVGANDWGCRPSAEQPHPVVLVHGTFGDQQSGWDHMSVRLTQAGYCVFSLDYGNRATGPVEDSAAELEVFVDEVLAATGAARVSLVGHSQGGMMPRYYIKNLSGDGKVEDLVGVVASNHGTYDSETLAPLEEFCYSCTQQASDSAFITELNSGDETPGSVDYTQIATKYDRVVVPYTSTFLEPGPASTNILLQDSCALDASEHLTAIGDPITIRWTLNALNRDGPADPDAPIGCL